MNSTTNRRRNRDSVWQGIDTRRANAAIRELAARAERERIEALPQRPQIQMIGCSLGCIGINHRASCPNVVTCAACGSIEWNRYEPRCLGCGKEYTK